MKDPACFICLVHAGYGTDMLCGAWGYWL